jgi:hypothetical protein
MRDIGSKKQLRYEEELVVQRDSKMRRFCNYLMTLFNQKKLNPFSQFVSQQDLDSLKKKVEDGLKMYSTQNSNNMSPEKFALRAQENAITAS